jgi:hypothetical protein
MNYSGSGWIHLSKIWFQTRIRPTPKMRMRSSLVRMRSSLVADESSLVVRASDCQCTSCNGPRFDPSIRRHRGIWGAADETVLNIVRNFFYYLYTPKNIFKKRIMLGSRSLLAPIQLPVLCCEKWKKEHRRGGSSAFENKNFISILYSCKVNSSCFAAGLFYILFF